VEEGQMLKNAEKRLRRFLYEPWRKAENMTIQNFTIIVRA